MKISLLENSHNFLKEALSKAIFAEEEPEQWKFAVFNLVQSIELVLKEKLRQEHPALIFSNVDKLQNTVSIEQAIKRLTKISEVEFSKKNIQDLSSARKWRNLIVHHEFELKPVELKVLFARLLGFLSYFNFKHLDETLDNIVPPNLFEKAIEIKDYASELFKTAEKHFEEKDIDISLIWPCNKCGWDAFVIQDEINTCYVCGWKESVVECPECHEFFYEDDGEELQSGDEEFELICDSCFQDYVEDMIAHEMAMEYR